MRNSKLILINIVEIDYFGSTYLCCVYICINNFLKNQLNYNLELAILKKNCEITFFQMSEKTKADFTDLQKLKYRQSFQKPSIII